MSIRVPRFIRLPLLFFLLCLPGPPAAFAGAADRARVITSVARPVACIAPISVYNLDGRLVELNAMGFDLEPGRHSLVGTARIDSVNCPVMRGNSSLDIPALEYDFEAGKTYYIGLEHQSANQQHWRFTVWKVEDSTR